jgi:hypothetical protein
MKKYLPISLCFLVLGLGTVCCAGATEVEITSPADGDTVSMIGEDIEGTSKDIPEGYELWIMVYPDGVNRFYPQDKRDLPLIPMANGDWTAEAIIGSDPDHGLEFKLYAVLANETANTEILDYLDRSREAGSWDGLEQLPDGAEIYDYVTVIRE